MILLVGGAGYLGSHVNQLLTSKGYETLVLDNLSYGHPRAVQWGKLIEGHKEDTDIVSKIFEEYPIDVVIDFAAFLDTGGSLVHPERFYQNNVLATTSLLDTMLDSPYLKKKNFIFSSTAEVYGASEEEFISEDHALNPMSTFGDSKMMVEQTLQDYSENNDFNFISLRYFNIAGNAIDALSEQSLIGRYEPEKYVILLILKAAMEESDNFEILGTDYPTPDGSCIRDYIHVSEVAHANLLACERLLSKRENGIFNICSGRPVSMYELVAAVEKLTQRKVPLKKSKPISQKPYRLVGNPRLAEEVLGWRSKFNDISELAKKVFEEYIPPPPLQYRP